jgi:uncharacterized coiled-coil DUF342 family protein
MPTPPASPLVEAAAQLEEELKRYEALTEEVARGAIHSRKSLMRVARLLQQAAECHEGIMKQVGVLSEAMTSTRGRQSSCAEKLVDAGKRVQERAAALQELLGRYDALGELSKALTADAAAITARKDEATPQAALEATGPLVERMQQAVDQATTLTDAARDADFTDLARDVDSVKQQLQSLRNQVMLARRALGERSPS